MTLAGGLSLEAGLPWGSRLVLPEDTFPVPELLHVKARGRREIDPTVFVVVILQAHRAHAHPVLRAIAPVAQPSVELRPCRLRRGAFGAALVQAVANGEVDGHREERPPSRHQARTSREGAAQPRGAWGTRRRVGARLVCLVVATPARCTRWPQRRSALHDSDLPWVHAVSEVRLLDLSGQVDERIGREDRVAISGGDG
eukprot:scaffold87939_cov79-Phaeocystis_antarctica.AAC.1